MRSGPTGVGVDGRGVALAAGGAPAVSQQDGGRSLVARGFYTEDAVGQLPLPRRRSIWAMFASDAQLCSPMRRLTITPSRSRRKLSGTPVVW